MRRATFDGWPKRDGILENFYPRNAAAAWTGSAGAAWAWPANYSQVVAATNTPFIPCVAHLNIRMAWLQAAAAYIWIEYEIALGGAGAEVTFHRHIESVSGVIVLPGESSQALTAHGLTIEVGPKLIPSGTRIAHRVRISVAAAVSSVGMSLYLAGYDGAVPAHYRPYDLRAHLAGVHGAQTRSFPSGSAVAVTAAAFPNYGNWAQVVAAAPADLLIQGAGRIDSVASPGARHIYLEIGTGPVDQEVPRGRLAFPGLGYAHIGLHRFLRRPVLVKKGERVVLRATGAAVLQNFIPFWEEV